MVSPYSFSSHGTFPLRLNWLKKAVSAVNDKSTVFQSDEAIVKFRVGKNMVRSIRHCGLATEVIELIDGGILARDPWRIDMLMLLAVSKHNDEQIVSEPRKMISLANSLAAAGIPKVTEMLKKGGGEPIWSSSEAVDSILRKGNTSDNRKGG